MIDFTLLGVKFHSFGVIFTLFRVNRVSLVLFTLSHLGSRDIFSAQKCCQIVAFLFSDKVGYPTFSAF